MESDNVDKKGNDDKFNFVTLDDIDRNVRELKEMLKETESNIEVVPTPEKVNATTTPFDEEQETADLDLEEKTTVVPIPEKGEAKEETMEEEHYEEATNLDDQAITFESPKPKKSFKHKLYFSFEVRVAILVALTLLFFGSACFLILEALNFGKKETVDYSEVSKATYEVCLKDSEYYGTGCLNEGMEYLSSLVDRIHTDFQYDVKFSTKIGYDLAYHIVAITKIYDEKDESKILYRNEEELVGKTDISNTSDTIQIHKDVQVNFSKYNRSVEEYRTRYGIDFGSTLEVILYLDEPTEVRKVASIVLPLGNPTFGITKDLTVNKNQSVAISNDVWNAYNVCCGIVATIFIIVSLLLLFKTTRLVFRVNNNRSKYQTALSDILREYDRLIVIARDGYESNIEKKVIKVESFNDILDARDTLEKPIIYSKINDIKSEFIVEDDEKLYKYVIKESDF